jgi:hypothetical protein
MNGDTLQYMLDNANVPLKERSDWPLSSFDANDWAEAFIATYEKADDDFLTVDTMRAWFANALMRGYDQGVAAAKCFV